MSCGTILALLITDESLLALTRGPEGKKRDRNKERKAYRQDLGLFHVPHAALGVDVCVENVEDLVLCGGLYDEGAAGKVEFRRVVALGGRVEVGAARLERARFEVLLEVGKVLPVNVKGILD